MPETKPSIQLSKLSQEFKDSLLEEKFQRDHWKERSQQNLTTVFIWTLVVGILLIIHWNEVWTKLSTFFYVIQFAGYGAVRWLSRRPHYYHSYDALITLTLTAMIMGVVSFRLLEPDNSVTMALFIMVPLVVTIALNIRFYYTLLLICVIIANYSWALHEAELYEDFNRLVSTQMLVSAGIGLVIQRLINASRHYDYARLLAEQNFSQEITQARLDAEKANNQKSLFLAQASHDIRTPMTGVLGLSRLLQKTDLDTKQRSLLQAIEASSNSLTNLMNQLLDLSRIEQGSFKLEEKVFQPRQTIYEVAHLLRPLAEEKILAIDTFTEPDADLIVHGDEGRLRQILINLVSNAIQYTDQGNIRIRLKVKYESTQTRTLIFEVTDSGEGIPAHEHGEIFNSFYQSGKIRNSYGLGLGLSISRDLAKALGGDLSYRNTSASRSTFTLSLPVTVVRENDKYSIPTQPPHDKLCGQVLVVEDNRINSLVIKETLLGIQPGFKIDTAFDGEQAVSLCRNHAYDLVLMDCMLPKLNGFSALRQIRDIAAHENTPIAAVTASATPEDERRCHAAGFNHFLTKPIDESSLLQVLNLHLSHHGSGIIPQTVYTCWNPADCLKQMGGKPEVLVKVVKMALEDLPSQLKAISETDISETMRGERIHHLQGTLRTLHASKLLDPLAELKKHPHPSNTKWRPFLSQIQTQMTDLQSELKLWLTRQQSP